MICRKICKFKIQKARISQQLKQPNKNSNLNYPEPGQLIMLKITAVTNVKFNTPPLSYCNWKDAPQFLL